MKTSFFSCFSCFSCLGRLTYVAGAITFVVEVIRRGPAIAASCSGHGVGKVGACAYHARPAP
jgi:hypothetical protein